MLLTKPLVLVAAMPATVASAGSVTAVSADAEAVPTIDPVISWNKALLEILRTPGVQPTSEILPGVRRSFATFSAAAVEAGLSRIHAGQHTRVEHAAGVVLGQHVADYVLCNELQKR